MTETPTIVLVHGAFADAASWAPVTRTLLDQGYRVRVPAVPNRSLIGDAAPVAAWTTKPGWGIVSAEDHTINPDVERFGYRRAGLRSVTELDAPHLVMQTHPFEVARVITDAIAELG